MGDDSLRSSDDEVVALIRTAFERQAIPAKPDVTAGGQPRDIFVPDLKETQRHENHFSKLLGSIPVVIISLLLVIAIWPQENSPTVEVKTSSPAEIPMEGSNIGQVGGQKPDDIKGEPSPDTSIAPSEKAPVPSVKDTAGKEGTETLESTLLRVVRLVNRYGIDPNFDFQVLSSTGVSYLGEESQPVWDGFASMGVAKGINSIREGVDETHSWIASENEVAFTYQIEMNELLNDLDRLIDGMLGEPILYPILDGLRDDPDGPKVDFRREVFARLKGAIMVVVNRSPRPDGDQMMLVAPMTEDASVSDVLTRIEKFEPQKSIEFRNGVRILVVPRGNRTQATAIAGGCWIFGSAEMVRHAIDRLAK